VVRDGRARLSAECLELHLPDGRRIVADVDLSVLPGERVLISGPSGAGKSTLFRALAGVWPFGQGRVYLPRDARLLFLPQRPYLPIASLRAATTYPAPAATFAETCVQEVLRAVGLDAFVDRLDEVDNWSLRLSGGEQQRLAIARAILQAPDWLFLDEATAALDEAAEHALYALLGDRLPGTAIISIAHRPGIACFHSRQVTLGSGAMLHEGRLAAALAG
jgi:putative ATP-binding cassette transporter